ncbi:MAG: nucleotidyltransferase domain-containing protein [Candidatus Thermoplasmatota archaeon]
MELDKNTMTIIKFFYEQKSGYLNELYRKTGVSKPTILKILRNLQEKKMLKQKNEANAKIYVIDLKNPITQKVFGFFDLEKLEKLNGRRKRALNIFLESLSMKPYFLLLFGSTAKGSYTAKSDIDVLVVYQSITKKIKDDIEQARLKAESVAGLQFQVFLLSQEDFIANLKSAGSTVRSAVEFVFPVHGQEHFYELMSENYER